MTISVSSKFMIATALLIGSAHATSFPSEIPAEIRALVEADRHQAHATGNGFEAHNPGQNWRLMFDGRGFQVQPQDDAWVWGLQLKSYGFGGAQHTIEGSSKASAKDGRVDYDWDGNLTEWHINDTRGLEHGYTLESRPEGIVAPVSPLTFDLTVRGSLQYKIQAGGQGVEFLDDTGAVALTYAGLHVFDARGITQLASFVGNQGGIRLEIHESTALYPLTIDPVAHRAYLKASNTDAGDSFSYSMDMSGDTLVVGAPFEDSNASGVNGNDTDNSLQDSGAAYVFVHNGTTWVQQAYLKSNHPDFGDNFGQAVAIDGNRIVIGVPGEDGSTGINGNGADNNAPNSGAALIFERTGSTWNQQAMLKASIPGLLDGFGQTAAISGDRIVIGSRGEDSAATGVNGNPGNNSAAQSGAAYVFDFGGGAWTQSAYLKASNTEGHDEFGCSVAIDGDLVVVGARSEASVSNTVNGNQLNNNQIGRGAAYIFGFNGSVWAQQAYLKGAGRTGYMLFGHSVAISGTTIAVGAPYESGNGRGINTSPNLGNPTWNSGAVFTFVPQGMSWVQDASIKAANADTSYLLGWSVVADGNKLLIGSPRDSSVGSGVDGSQTRDPNSFFYGSGAALLFEHDGSTWTQTSFIKAPAPELLDSFGNTLCLSGNFAVVGAIGEDSASTGVDGDPLNNLAPESGAAYTLRLDAQGTIYCDPAVPNLTGLPASISQSGSVLTTDNNFTLHVDDLPPNQTGYFLNSRGTAYFRPPGGAHGFLCLGGGQAIGRHNRSWEVRNSGATGSFSLTLDLTDLPVMQTVIPGETWNFQCWYRDPINPGASNFSNGLSVRFD